MKSFLQTGNLLLFLLLNGSGRDILGRTHRKLGMRPKVDNQLQTNVIGAIYPDGPDEVREAETEIYNSQILDQSIATLNKKDCSKSFSLLFPESVCTNKDVGDALCNCSRKMFLVHYNQLKSSFEQFQSMADI